ncbi:MAG: SpoIIE family protein phosphatase, partial [Casimicrobiaceae bacterium]
VSDGVTEAQNPAQELYGSGRAASVLVAADSAGAAVALLRADVEAFAGDADPADDMTVLALCWRGADTPGRGT